MISSPVDLFWTVSEYCWWVLDIAWLALAVFALTRDAFLGSWLLLTSALASNAAQVISFSVSASSPGGYSEFYDVLANLLFLLSGALLLGAFFFWLMRGAAAVKRAKELELYVASELKQ